jgi:hypothetical protein
VERRMVRVRLQKTGWRMRRRADLAGGALVVDELMYGRRHPQCLLLQWEARQRRGEVKLEVVTGLRECQSGVRIPAGRCNPRRRRCMGDGARPRCGLAER